MANAVCPNCGNSSFACELRAVKNIDVPIGFIYCTACFITVGTYDPMLNNMSNKFKEIDDLDTLTSNIPE